MATIHGNEGTVMIGANNVAEIKSWSVNETAETADDSSMNDASRSHLVGKKAWDGTIECHFDDTDANGQETMTIGAAVTLLLYAEGDGTPALGDREYTGAVTITGVSVGVEQDSVVSRTFTFQGNGDLTIQDKT